MLKLTKTVRKELNLTIEPIISQKLREQLETLGRSLETKREKVLSAIATTGEVMDSLNERIARGEAAHRAKPRNYAISDELAGYRDRLNQWTDAKSDLNATVNWLDRISENLEGMLEEIDEVAPGMDTVESLLADEDYLV